MKRISWVLAALLLTGCVSTSEEPDQLRHCLQDEVSDKQSLVVGQADAAALPFDDNSFDVVLMNSVLYFVPD